MPATPERSRGGPLTTDRPTAENSGEKFTSDGTPPERMAYRTRVAMSSAAIRDVLEVDLSRHVTRDGLVCVDGRAAVHRSLAVCPAGVAVRIRIGRALWIAPGVIDLLAELTYDADQLEVVGSDDRGVAQVVGGLRDRLEQAVA